MGWPLVLWTCWCCCLEGQRRFGWPWSIATVIKSVVWFVVCDPWFVVSGPSGILVVQSTVECPYLGPVLAEFLARWRAVSRKNHKNWWKGEKKWHVGCNHFTGCTKNNVVVVLSFEVFPSNRLRFRNSRTWYIKGPAADISVLTKTSWFQITGFPGSCGFLDREACIFWIFVPSALIVFPPNLAGKLLFG